MPPDPVATRSPAGFVYLGLGSNLGDRVRTLVQAVHDLEAVPGFRRLALSSLYETDPIADTPQPRFLNAALKGQTSLSPLSLLEELERLEQRAGRSGKGAYEPRTLDLDLLVYGDTQMDSPRLTLPHPRLKDREFVLAPLAEIAGDLRLAGGVSVGEMLAGVAGGQGVSLCPSEQWNALRAALPRH